MKHPIETIRHSTAHIMAAAILELFPGTKLGVGPVVEHGFYYDVETIKALTEDDLVVIEERMKQIVKRDDAFAREEMNIDDAIAFFKKLDQVYKVELLEDLKTKGTTSVRPEEAQDIDADKPSVVTVYKTGEFIDLCRGPHVTTSSEVGAFKITKLAGAYWRGNEKNKQLQRIYGLAFSTKEELVAHLAMLAEAEKRDHRKLGAELDLFLFSDLVGAGLPLWTPRGTLLRTLLDEFVWEMRHARGYQKVEIPHITKKDLYEKSGHWEKFQNELFRVASREKHEFAMKPMNCPHHTQIYARKQWSYRELPQRYSNTTMCYRDEQTGELAGLTRARSFTQDDAHVFCRLSQVKEEFLKVYEIIQKFYSTFGFELSVRLSLHDPKHPEKYLGGPENWKVAEDTLREIIADKKLEAIDGVGEAAFYGPKLDFMAKDSLGRQWQVATIQLDMNMPERFDLSCINEEGKHERIVMIHAAIMGSIERFMAVLIEHLGGVFPLWLAPEQVSIASVAERHNDIAKALQEVLQKHGIRVGLDISNESVGKKVRIAEKMKVPFSLVVGDKEAPVDGVWHDEVAIAVRAHGSKEAQTMTLGQFIAMLTTNTADRTLSVKQ